MSTMSKVYKFINFPDHESISEKIYDYVVNCTDVTTVKAVWNTIDKDRILQGVPELDEAFSMLGLTPLTIAIIYCEAGTNLPIHIDGDHHPLDGVHCQSRLLWPVKNCKGSHTTFYSLESVGSYDNIKKYTTTIGDVFFQIEDVSGLKPIADVELVMPAVIKPWLPHGVHSNPECKEPRFTMTVLFDKSLDYLLD